MKIKLPFMCCFDTIFPLLPDNPYLEGTKINSPHYLAKMRPPKGTSRYSLVISQYEKYNTIFYTLKVFPHFVLYFKRPFVYTKFANSKLIVHLFNQA